MYLFNKTFNLQALTIVGVFFFVCFSNSVRAQTGSAEGQIKLLGIQMIEPAPSIANYLKAVQVGNLVYLSGHGPDKPTGGQIIGKVGSNLTSLEAKEADRLVGISLLSTLKAQIGDLNKVKRVVKVLALVNSEPWYTDHPQVVNGFSDLMVEVFGESGKHARSSVGVGSLPGNIPVEIEMIVELK